jgi:hypothetical protein
MGLTMTTPTPGIPPVTTPATTPVAAHITPLERLRVPLGGQDIELQQVDYAAGGMSLLRTRIREGRRFTVFDIDAGSARAWGQALLRWAEGQPG